MTLYLYLSLPVTYNNLPIYFLMQFEILVDKFRKTRFAPVVAYIILLAIFYIKRSERHIPDIKRNHYNIYFIQFG